MLSNNIHNYANNNNSTPTRKISFQLGPTGGYIMSTNNIRMNNTGYNMNNNNEYTSLGSPSYMNAGNNGPANVQSVKVYRTEMTILPSSSAPQLPPYHNQSVNNNNNNNGMHNNSINSGNNNLSPKFFVGPKR